MKKILIAEDDPVTRKILSHCVENMGHVAILCANGDIAMEILSTNDVDLLITDVAMPSMDGEQLIRCIRGLEEFRKLPIVIISAVVNSKEISHLLDMGASRFLPKPINVHFLDEYIHQLLDHPHNVCSLETKEIS